MTPADQDLDRQLDGQPWRGWHSRIAGLLLLTFFFNAYCTLAFAMAVPAITEDWRIAATALAAPMAATLLGTTVGSLVGGMLGDVYGRRPTAAASLILIGLATIACAAATAPWQMTVLLAIAGLGIGAALPPSMAMMAECMPARRRGLLISFAMNCTPIGIAVCAMAAALLLPIGGWEANFIVGGTGALASGALLWLFADESPRFLVRRPARQRELDRVLQRLDIVAVPQAGPQPEAATHSGTRMLFSPELRPLTVRIGLAFIAVYLAIGVMMNWEPVALTGAGYSIAIASSAISFWSIGGIAGGFVAGLCMARWSPARTAQVCAVVSAASLALLAALKLGPASGSWPILAAMMLVGATLSALMTATFAVVAEAYTDDLRSVGIGVAATAGRASSVIGGYAGIHVLNAVGLHTFHLLIGIVALLPALILLRRRPAEQDAPPLASPQTPA